MNQLNLTDEQIDEAALRMAMEVLRADGSGAKDEPCPECDGTGECWDCDGTGESEDNHDDDGECSACYGMGMCSSCDGDGLLLKPGRSDDSPASALSRAWEAASGKDQVVS